MTPIPEESAISQTVKTVFDFTAEIRSDSWRQ